MKRVLTIDDSRALRAIVKRALGALEDIELFEAEDGQKGLAAVEEHRPDLILLDVTMPVMDGPETLRQLRASGDDKPVILLTAESKMSVIAPMMKQGFQDYIVKPFKNEELVAKVTKVLGLEGASAGAASAESAAAAKGSWADSFESAADLLLVDDMENVAKRLRSMMPATISMKNCLDSTSAISICRRFAFRVVVQDLDIPNINRTALFGQLRALQPDAAFVALAMRNMPDASRIAKQIGFNSVIYKPFDPTQIEDFLGSYFASQELLSVEDNVITVEEFKGSKERYQSFFARLTKLLKEALDNAAAACFDNVVLDTLKAPSSPDHLVKLIVFAVQHASSYGMGMRLVTDNETAKMLQGIAETAKLGTYESAEEARAA
jgi:CheY-like chemotaxis protein